MQPIISLKLCIPIRWLHSLQSLLVSLRILLRWSIIYLQIILCQSEDTSQVFYTLISVTIYPFSVLILHGKRMINTDSLNRLMAELNAINWSFIYENETDAQLGYTDFINIFKKVYDKCIPIRYVKRKVNPSKPWLTEGLMKWWKLSKLKINCIRKEQNHHPL